MSTLALILGVALLSSPFIAGAALVVREEGWRELATVVGVMLAITLPIVAGSALVAMAVAS